MEEILKEILNKNTSSDNKLELVSKYFSEKHFGNFLEIGAGHGDTTIVFLKTLQGTDRKVFVVDPFEEGWFEMPKTYGEPYPFHIFERNTKKYSYNLELIKKSSLDSSVISHFEPNLSFDFAFIDGLQFKESVLSDLHLCKKLNCKVICLDDFTRITNESQVPMAVDEFLKKNVEYSILYSENINVRAKVYLIKK